MRTRPKAKPRGPAIRVVGTQKNCVIRGTTSPGATIEVFNLSASPRERVRPNEAIVIARADERGVFAGKLPMRPHDLLRVRARSPSGAAGKSVAFRARGIVGRPRPLHVALFRIALRDLGDGTIRIFNLNPSRPIAEPGAVLTITNTRTDDAIRIEMNVIGSIEGRVRIPGRAGDRLRVVAETSTQRPRSVGALLTPSLAARRERNDATIVPLWRHHQKVAFAATIRRFRAPLFRGAPRPGDVYQSELPNCYLASAAAAIAQASPHSLAAAITRVREGTYRVRFHDRDKKTARYRFRHVVVTSDLWVRPSGELLYASTRGLERPPVLWWPLLEKAFARLKGGYARVGRGGTSHRVFELLLGRPPHHFFIDPTQPDVVWAELTRTIDARLPVVAGTSPPWTAKKFWGTGLVPDHAYSVLGYRSGKRRKISLRNPWGEDVGRPSLVRKNGAFEIDFDEFMRLFQVVSTVR